MPPATPNRKEKIAGHSFGNWVRRRRKALDLTQQELAQRVGCSISLIFKIEADARRPSRQIAELLAEQLKIPPDQRDRFLKVARQERGVDHLETVSPLSSPEVAPAPSPFHSILPHPLTSLVGREHELRALIQQLHDPACRLLTLAGPGGIGKTRLALEVALQLQDSFEHGACFVSLVGASSSEFIIPAIADMLGFGFSSSTDLKTQLFHYLQDKEILLVLDNLEHLLNGIELLDELLEHAPRVKVLTTSREQLNLRIEWVFEVQGLPVPANGGMEALETNSAVTLFVQRAKQMNLKFILAPDDLPAIMRICRFVEGMPLGLELAATWVRMISVNEVALEIERSLDFLTTTTRDIPQRHRSIRAVFDYSWNLLMGAERQAMRRLSVFRGGFTREAAEQITHATLPVLSALVEKSLIRRNENGRYDLHELLRQYAAAHLQEDAEEDQATRVRHTEYYSGFLQSHESALLSHHQKNAVAELSADIDNLRVAWDSSVAFQQIDLMQKGMPSLWRFYDVRNYCQEGVALFARGAVLIQQLLATLDADDSAQERANLEGILGDTLAYQAYFTRRLGRNAAALAIYQASIVLLRPLKQRSALAHVLADYGALCCATGEYDQAWSYFSECLPLFQVLGNKWQEARCLAFMGWLKHDQGDNAESYRLLSDALGRFRILGDPRHIAVTSNFLSRTMQALGRVAEVQELLSEGLRLAAETGDQLCIGMMLERLAVVAQTRKDVLEARRLFAESLTCFRNIGDSWSLSRALNLQGYFALTMGDNLLAHTSFQEACQVAMPAQLNPNVLDALTGLAMLDAQEGRGERALESVLFIPNHPASAQTVKERAQKLRTELEDQLTPRQIESAWARLGKKSLVEFAGEILQATQ